MKGKVITASLLALSFAPTESAIFTRTSQLYEAEDANFYKSRVKSGSGVTFVDMGGEGSWFELDNIDGGSQGGPCILKFRYALGGRDTPRPCGVTIDGQSVGTLSFEVTGGFSAWENEDLSVVCGPGANTVRVTALEEGGPNVDSISVTPSGTPTSPVSHTPTVIPSYVTSDFVTNEPSAIPSSHVSSDFGTNEPSVTSISTSPSLAPSTRTSQLYEAEDADNLYKSKVRSGSGVTFVDMGGEGSWFELDNIDGGSQGGPCILKFRYALAGRDTPRPCDVTIGGQSVGTLSFEGTGGFSAWENEDLSGVCGSGENTVRVTAREEGGPNVDSISVTLSGTPTSPVSHTPTAIPSYVTSDFVTNEPSAIPSSHVSSDFGTNEPSVTSISTSPSLAQSSTCAAIVEEKFCQRRLHAKGSLVIKKMTSRRYAGAGGRDMRRACTVLIADVQFRGGQHERLVECRMSIEDGGRILPIKGVLPEGIISGASTIFSDSARIFPNKLLIPEGVSVLVRRAPGIQNGSFSDSPSVGNKNVLAIIVEARDKNVKGTTDDKLSDLVFGTGGAEVSVKSQYEDCSFKKMNITMAQNEAPEGSINGGVITVKVSKDIEGSSSRDFVDYVNSQASTVGLSLPGIYDHIIYCLPKGSGMGTGSSTNWKAFAYYNSYISMYNDQCSSLSMFMHELGHNLNLGHSNDEDNNEYKDTSGYMGRSTRKSDGPKKCFNGPKNWQLGWYTDRQVLLKPRLDTYTAWEGTLVGIAEYDLSSPDQYVIVRIDQQPMLSAWDYYISFNREKKGSCNSDTGEGANQVLIHAMNPTDGTGPLPSSLMDKLSKGKSHTIYQSKIEIIVSNINTKIEPATATVKVIVKDSPTKAPTKMPVSFPTQIPSGRPSKISIEPSASGSRNTLHPSFRPSTYPSTVPCDDLTKSQCKKRKNECKYYTPEKVGLCSPKKTKFEHECSQYKTEDTCNNVSETKGYCIFSSGKCFHVCISSLKEEECKEVKVEDKKVCKQRKVDGPCLGCYKLPICSTG